jgi:hypothetical protein
LAFITHISRTAPGRVRLKAIFVAAFDQAGPMLAPVVVSWVDLPPAAGTTKIADVPANAIERSGKATALGLALATGAGLPEARDEGLALGTTIAMLAAALGGGADEGAGEPPRSAKTATPARTTTSAPPTIAANGTFRPLGGGGGGAATSGAWRTWPQ